MASKEHRTYDLTPAMPIRGISDISSARLTYMDKGRAFMVKGISCHDFAANELLDIADLSGRWPRWLRESWGESFFYERDEDIPCDVDPSRLRSIWGYENSIFAPDELYLVDVKRSYQGQEIEYKTVECALHAPLETSDAKRVEMLLDAEWSRLLTVEFLDREQDERDDESISPTSRHLAFAEALFFGRAQHMPIIGTDERYHLNNRGRGYKSTNFRHAAQDIARCGAAGTQAQDMLADIEQLSAVKRIWHRFESSGLCEMRHALQDEGDLKQIVATARREGVEEMVSAYLDDDIPLDDVLA